MTALFDGMRGPRRVTVRSVWTRLDLRTVMVRIIEADGHEWDSHARNLITVHGAFGTLCRTIPLNNYNPARMTGVPL